jgi:DNA-binding NarL/FixJ family response regulator
MSNIFIFTKNPRLLKKWKNTLADCHNVQFTTDIFDIPVQINAISLIIIDTFFLEKKIISLDYFERLLNIILLVGEKYPESDQIAAMAAGASGYCEYDDPEAVFLKAVESVINGEIWMQRHLVPKVIGSLVKIPDDESAKKNDVANEILINGLSARELDVAKMIGVGKTNKIIATSLEISERTVKAHLTSIYRKLGVPDRLHLAIAINSFDMDRNVDEII